MTFKQLQDEVIALRFQEGRRASIKSWINARYAYLWALEDWTFKRVPPTNITVVNGSRTPAMPTDFGHAERLFDDQGAELAAMDVNDWDEAFKWDTSTGRPSSYTLVSRQLYLGPTPNANYTFTMSYTRRLTHVDSITGITGGVMVEDADQALWPAEYDYLLVLEAAMMGMQLEKDEGWQDLRVPRDELLEAMRGDLTSDAVATKTQYGKVSC